MEPGSLVVPLELSGADVGEDESLLTLRLEDGQKLLEPVQLTQGVRLIGSDEVVALVVDVGVEADQVERELNRLLVDEVVATYLFEKMVYFFPNLSVLVLPQAAHLSIH